MADLTALRERNNDFWAQAAPGWVRHAARQDELGEPLGADAMSALAASAGERIVDIGCGCGGTTASIAAGVGRTGAAVGVDLAAEMIAEARRRFPDGPSFETVDVDATDVLPGAPFDAAYARMSLMLLADPVAGCATVRRSLRPGGRLAATVFRGPEVNPWLAGVVLGAAPHLGALPPLPLGDEPGPFAFARAERIRQILTDAGFTGIGVEERDVTVVAPDEPEAVAEWLIEVGPAGLPYRRAEEPDRAEARAGAVDLLRRFRRPGEGYRLPAGIWLVTAVTP